MTSNAKYQNVLCLEFVISQKRQVKIFKNKETFGQIVLSRNSSA